MHTSLSNDYVCVTDFWSLIMPQTSYGSDHFPILNHGASPSSLFACIIPVWIEEPIWDPRVWIGLFLLIIVGPATVVCQYGKEFSALASWFNVFRAFKFNHDDDALITINSGLVPLIEGLCAEILHFRFEIIGGLRSHFLLLFLEGKVCERKNQLVQDLIPPLSKYRVIPGNRNHGFWPSQPASF